MRRTEIPMERTFLAFLLYWRKNIWITLGKKIGLCISEVNRSFNNFAFPKHDSLRAGLTDSSERFYIRSGRPLVTGFYWNVTEFGTRWKHLNHVYPIVSWWCVKLLRCRHLFDVSQYSPVHSAKCMQQIVEDIHKKFTQNCDRQGKSAYAWFIPLSFL